MKGTRAAPGSLEIWHYSWAELGVIGIAEVDNHQYLAQSGQPENLLEAIVDAAHAEIATLASSPFEATDENAETGGVDEVYLTQIHDEIEVSLSDLTDDFLTKLWGKDLCKQ